jgi:hypothetical protein
MFVALGLTMKYLKEFCAYSLRVSLLRKCVSPWIDIRPAATVGTADVGGSPACRSGDRLTTATVKSEVVGSVGMFKSDIRKCRRLSYRLEDNKIAGNRLERCAPDSCGSGRNGKLCKHGTEPSCSIIYGK